MVEGELKLSDRLARERTLMAAERTLMAWVRTALSLISFGFTIYKVLEQFQTSAVGRASAGNGPRNLGLLLIFLGTYSLAMGTDHHWHEMRQLGKAPKAILKSNGVILAGVITLLGVFLFVSIVMHRELF